MHIQEPSSSWSCLVPRGGTRWGKGHKAGKGGKSHETDGLACHAKGIELYSVGKGEPLKSCHGKEVTRSVGLERSCCICCGLLEWQKWLKAGKRVGSSGSCPGDRLWGLTQSHSFEDGAEQRETFQGEWTEFGDLIESGKRIGWRKRRNSGYLFGFLA